MQPSIHLICKSVHFSAMLRAELQEYGLEISDNAEYIVLVESSLGSAVTELENSEVDPSKVIVFTPNPCLEYCQDVLDMGVAGLIFNSLTSHTIISALELVTNGQQFRILPNSPNAGLSTIERQVLMLVARSFEDKEISVYFEKRSDRTIQKDVMCIFEKLRSTYPDLRFNNRSCLVHYYHGLWSNIRYNCLTSKRIRENRAKNRS